MRPMSSARQLQTTRKDLAQEGPTSQESPVSQKSSALREEPTRLYGHSCKATWLLQPVSVTAYGPTVCQKPTSLERQAWREKLTSLEREAPNKIG